MPEVRKKSRERAPSLFSVGELPPVDGELRIPKVEINTVVPRVQALDAVLMLLIEQRTRSAMPLYRDGPRPTHAVIPMLDFQRFTQKSERTITGRLRFLEEIGYVTRQIGDNATHRGGYRTCPENYRKRDLPQPRPPRHRERTQPIQASMRASTSAAALRLDSREDPPAGMPLQEILVLANIGRMVQQMAAESGVTPNIAELQQIQVDAKAEATRIIAEPKAAQPIAAAVGAQTAAAAPASTPVQPAPADSLLPNFMQPAAELPRPIAVIPLPDGLTSATCCHYGWLCPLFDAAPKARSTETELQTETVSRSVQEPAGTDRPTESPSTPELSPELAAIAAAIPEELCMDLGDLPSRPLLELISTALDDTPLSPWFTGAIARARKRITSLGMLAYVKRDGNLDGIAVDAAKAYKKSWRAAEPPPAQMPPPPTVEDLRAREEYYERHSQQQAEWLHLLEHPEDCPHCHGTGEIEHVDYPGRKFKCGCPIGTPEGHR